uniref:SWIM-type domain-containing protein n=1 Tax=Panagrolaimus sp. ES5 TaxID=591445 RepID=A0AC34G170_9BILA
MISRFKKHVDVEVFSDMKDINEIINNEDDGITYICGEEINDEIDCTCEDNELRCQHGVENLNLKPLKENIVMENVYFTNANIKSLQKVYIVR